MDWAAYFDMIHVNPRTLQLKSDGRGKNSIDLFSSYRSTSLQVRIKARTWTNFKKTQIIKPNTYRNTQTDLYWSRHSPDSYENTQTDLRIDLASLNSAQNNN